MPDRLPPSWGREPEAGRDLDALLSAEAPLSVEALLADEALLSGQMTGISESQRPVAGAMFALRAAPVASELAGEAAARAAFRALIEPAGTLPARAVPMGAGPMGAGPMGAGPAVAGPAFSVPADYRASSWAWGDPSDAEPHHTLVLPVPVAGQDQGPRPPARHRHRKRATIGRGGWQVMAMLGSVAAAVAIGVAALAGTFSGSAGQQRHPGSPSAVQTSAPQGGGVSAAPGVLGQATKDPTPSATPKASVTPGGTPGPKAAASRGSALCREYFRFNHRGDAATRKTVFHELSRLAGTGSFSGVLHYCADLQDQHLFTMPPEPTSSAGSWPWFHGPGSDGSNGGPGTSTGPGQTGSGQAGYGLGGSGREASGTRASGSR
jgi:hypothetical protein